MEVDYIVLDHCACQRRVNNNFHFLFIDYVLIYKRLIRSRNINIMHKDKQHLDFLHGLKLLISIPQPRVPVVSHYFSPYRTPFKGRETSYTLYSYKKHKQKYKSANESKYNENEQVHKDILVCSYCGCLRLLLWKVTVPPTNPPRIDVQKSP